MIDERGSIKTIADGDFKCVQLIESRKGSIRSNHMHKKGGHWLYVLSGKMIYREYAVHPDDLITVRCGDDFSEQLIPLLKPDWDLVREVGPGEKIWSGPWMYHQTEFLEDTVMVSCAITPLDHDSYESDTVRWGALSLTQVHHCA